MVSPGKFVLYDGVIPALRAGEYQLTARHDLESAQATGLSSAPLNSRIRVTAPRYKLPPDQVLSTFPPANSEGAYEARLPQIVMKNRSLPWERRPHRTGDPATRPAADDNTPWLALVVIAEGEGELSVEVPIADCVTEAVPMPGQADVVKGVYLAVPETTVRKVFPTVEDLRLLAHVREVNKDDTENAMGDDDGFMSVIMANRLPQFDRIQCKPMRYIACLINLEGQLHVLPKPTPPTLTFNAIEYVYDARQEATILVGDPDILFMGGSPGVGPGSGPLINPLPDTGTGPAAMVRRSRISATPAASRSAGSPPPMPRVGTVKRAAKGYAPEWKAVTSQVENSAITANSHEAAFVVRDEMKAGFRFHFEPYISEKTYRFPVLAHWSFTCTGAGSLDTILQELDVGLLGTLPGPDAKPPRPECLPDVSGVAPPPAPLPRPAPEVTETGHVGLPHQTRAGEHRRAWYRGPFTPHATKRSMLENSAGTVLAHVSDQLRATVPDGREDLSLATAFEIGRLLALSRPSVIAALMRWRREQFGAARSRRLAGAALQGSGFDNIPLNELNEVPIADIGRLVGKEFIATAAAKPAQVLGNPRPIADPGRPIDPLEGDVADLLIKGLGIALDGPAVASRSFDPSLLDGLEVPIADIELDKLQDERLKFGLGQVVEDLSRDILQSGNTLSRDLQDGGPQDTDALGRLIRRLRQQREKEIR